MHNYLYVITLPMSERFPMTYLYSAVLSLGFVEYTHLHSQADLVHYEQVVMYYDSPYVCISIFCLNLPASES